MKRMDEDWVWKNEELNGHGKNEDAWKWILLPSIHSMNEKVHQDWVWKNEELNWVICKNEEVMGYMEEWRPNGYGRMKDWWIYVRMKN